MRGLAFVAEMASQSRPLQFKPSPTPIMKKFAPNQFQHIDLKKPRRDCSRREAITRRNLRMSNEKKNTFGRRVLYIPVSPQQMLPKNPFAKERNGGQSS